MTAKAVYEHEPEFVVPPGETLLETIEALDITQADLAKRTSRPVQTINEIINGKAAITHDTALQFERVLGVPASFWTNLENDYRNALAAQKENNNLRKDLGWKEQFPIKKMIKAGWIEKKDDDIEQFKVLLNFFSVATPKAWKETWEQPVMYRKTTTFKSNIFALSAWLRQGEKQAENIDTQPFNKGKFREVLNETLNLTNIDNFQELIPLLVEKCASAGVALVIVPEIEGCRASGATKWIYSDKPMIILSLRYGMNDHFWFTFYHEAAHVILHGKKNVFIEEDQTEDPKEQEANNFAANYLIPSKEFNKICESGIPGEEEIKGMAMKLSIAPGIIVGRLQKESIISFKQFNHFKVNYKKNL